MAKYFTVKQTDNRWILVDPDGKPFYSLGVDCVIAQITEGGARVVHNYGGGAGWFKKWADEKLEQVKDMGFNTLGAWHEKYYWNKDIPKTIELRMTRHSRKVNHVWGVGFPDVFDASFKASVYAAIAEYFHRDNGNALEGNQSVIGYFTDNELHWWGSAGQWGKDDQGAGRNSTGLVEDYFRLPPDASGKKAWVSFLKEKYKTIEGLNQKWESEYSNFDELLWAQQYRAEKQAIRCDKEEFLRIIAEEYFSVTDSVLKQYAPNHLNLGCRLVGTSAPDIVLEVMSRYVDVVSINFYSMKLPKEYLDHLYEITHKPIMITEFSFCAGSTDGFMHNTNGAQNVIVKNQAARAEAYDAFVTGAYHLPYMVGTHWFAFYDYHGDMHGLIGNYGLYNLDDKPWEELVAGVKQTNTGILKDFNMKTK